MAPALMDAIITGEGAVEIPAKLMPVLVFIRKLTLAPAQMTQVDADRVYAAGWNEQALHDAIEVCALFNFMNRYVEGHGLTFRPDQFKHEGKRLQGGYKPILKVLGLE